MTRKSVSPYYLYKRKFARAIARARRERNLQLAEALVWAEKKINLQHEELAELAPKNAELSALRAENARLRAQLEPHKNRKKSGAHWRRRKRAIERNPILGLVRNKRGAPKKPILDQLIGDPILVERSHLTARQLVPILKRKSEFRFVYRNVKDDTLRRLINTARRTISNGAQFSPRD